MKQAEWDVCDTPRVMLDALAGTGHARKFRLFACACCRRVWGELGSLREQFRAAVDLAERHADGLAWDVEMSGPAAAPGVARRRPGGGVIDALLGVSAQRAASVISPWAVRLRGDFDGIMAETDIARQEALAKEQRAQADLIRDIFGPIPPPIPRHDLSWLGHHEDEIARLARGIYQEGAFADLPILGDALEEAGCPDAVMLEHCRSGGEHVRGCWVVDALMGR
jgi:hypothetical protein